MCVTEAVGHGQRGRALASGEIEEQLRIVSAANPTVCSANQQCSGPHAVLYSFRGFSHPRSLACLGTPPNDACDEASVHQLIQMGARSRLHGGFPMVAGAVCKPRVELFPRPCGAPSPLRSTTGLVRFGARVTRSAYRRSPLPVAGTPDILMLTYLARIERLSILLHLGLGWYQAEAPLTALVQNSKPALTGTHLGILQ